MSADTPLPSDPSPNVSAQVPTRLDVILDDATLVLATITGLGGLINPGVAAGGALAGKLLALVSAGVKAHESITGQPLDLSKLHRIDLIP